MTVRPRRIDLNADLGEEHGDDAAIFPFLSSANIACGGHAGGVAAMDAALELAAQHEVIIGAHVSYVDRINFGRRPMRIGHEELTRQLRQQIADLREHAEKRGLAVRYVKPHGALYHQVGVDHNHAQALVDAVKAEDPSLELLVPASSLLQQLADPIPCRTEFFADRGYHRNGTLVERGHPMALVTTVDEITQRTLEWLSDGRVRSVEGTRVRIDAVSVCLHGDSPFAVASAAALHQAARDAGYEIRNWMEP